VHLGSLVRTLDERKVGKEGWMDGYIEVFILYRKEQALDIISKKNGYFSCKERWVS